MCTIILSELGQAVNTTYVLAASEAFIDNPFATQVTLESIQRPKDVPL